MRFKRHSQLEFGKEQLDIAPLIDVIFQLLIFFMLSSSFTFQSSINVKLPKAVTSDVMKEKNVIITITNENIIYFNEKIVSPKELEKKLADVNKELPLLIKSDRRASVGRIVDVWDLCRELGIERINIATTQEQ
ncbi:ExbD/TolR family protein [Candidatus Omnitrophota bacterium]